MRQEKVGLKLMENVSPHTYKKYRCSRCGHERQINTNHYEKCSSWRRVNTCPVCPPWAKYPEYGGVTIWECMEKPPR